MLFAFFVSIILFIVPTEKKNKNVEIEQIAVTGIHKNEIIMNAQKIAFEKKGNIYLTDKVYCRLNVYDKNLKHVFSFGKKGKGNGEFKAPSQVTVNNKRNRNAKSEIISKRALSLFILLLISLYINPK